MLSFQKSYRYIYLHGLASGPQSNKARFFRDRFAELEIDLDVPDLNQPDFFDLTVTRQVQQVQQLITAMGQPVVLLGSSLGALTATYVANQCEQVHDLVLLAPAFQFRRNWLSVLGLPVVEQWKVQDMMQLYHYGYQRETWLSYRFWQDLVHYEAVNLTRQIPTLIFHGMDDEIISMQSSQKFVQDHPWSQLILLKSDHSLGNCLDSIWQTMQSASVVRFCDTG